MFLKPGYTSRSIRNVLMASAIATGAVGFGLGSSKLQLISPALAEAVKVEAPAAFSFGDVVEAVSPAVVSVRVEAALQPANHNGYGFDRRSSPGRDFGLEDFFRNFPNLRPDNRGGERQNPRNKRRHGMSQGSGFFVSEDGFVVTNNHVIENGSKFTVVMADGSELDASLIGSDPRTDLAVLKVEATQKFTYVDFGDARPRTGDWVVAVGNPFGLGGTVTAGIVSAHGREIGASRYDDFIQIDAAVNKGNSGGPAFNLKGEVIGVNTAIYSPSGGNVGIAFAIPAALANEVVDDLINNGEVVRGWLGVQIQPVTDEIAESLGLEFSNGAIVTNPQNGSPADKAGIEAGDVIASVDGKSIKGPRELAKTIGSYDPDAVIQLEVWRDGEKQLLDVTLGELESAQNAGEKPSVKPAKFSKLGLELETLPEGNGVLVRDVKPGSKAAKRGIRPGDVVVSVNGEEISSSTDMENRLDAASQKGRKSALLQIERQGNALFVPLPVSRG